MSSTGRSDPERAPEGAKPEDYGAAESARASGTEATEVAGIPDDGGPALGGHGARDSALEDAEADDAVEAAEGIDVAEAATTVETRFRRHPAWYAMAGALLLVVTGLLAVALYSITIELIVDPDEEIYFLTGEPPLQPSGPDEQRNAASYLNIAVVGLDESEGTATLRLFGHRTCGARCEALDISLFSFSNVHARRFGLPPSAKVRVPREDEEITATVELPVSGHPSLFPFDAYTMVLAVRVLPAKTDGVAPPEPVGDTPHYISLQSHLKRMNMSPLTAVDPQTVSRDADPYAFPIIVGLEFRRPLYLPVLALLLPIFITGAALYSVRTQPLNQLLLGVGALVLGVWGIRSILVPSSLPYITAVDLVLSLVILILLGLIISRSFYHFHRTGRHPSGE